ncbi:uncharacterized protein LOC144145345 [Haemaphysalis longicornis]
METVLHRYASMIGKLTWLFCFGLLSWPLVFSFQPMRWCGGPLNPIEAAKAGRMSTEILFSCKEELKTLNTRPAVIKEAARVCAGCRLCFAVAEDDKNVSTTFFEKFAECVRKIGTGWIIAYPKIKERYNLDINKTVDVFKGCVKRLRPEDLPYVLQTVDYIRNFISG